MKGFYRLRLINKFTGDCRVDTQWFPNTILDSGRNDAMPSEANWLSHCQVGESADDPNVLDTALIGYKAGTNNIVDTVHGRQSSAPFYGWKRITYRFAAGDTAAILAEVGVGWGVSGSTLVSRAKIIDPITKEPTTITPLGDEILDVTYEMRYYPPLEDTFNTVYLEGISYNTITRASSVTSVTWSQDIGKLIGEYSPNTFSWSAFSGDIGDITEGPSGIQEDSDNSGYTNSAYSNNSFQRAINAQVGPPGWNVTGGIRSIRIQTTAGSYQTQFEPKLPKTASKSISMSWTIGWDTV